MSIELISIGNELLSGITLNTNLFFLSEQLTLRGWEVAHHAVVPDDPARIEEELKRALERSSLVIVTGGLGPTCDDVTRQVAAALFHSDFWLDETIAETLTSRYGKDHPSIIDQATIPKKAKPLLNDVGTAPGLIFQEGKRLLILLPGIPQEMQPMFLAQVVPFLENSSAKRKLFFQEILHLCLTSENTIDPLLRKLREKNPDVEVGIYPSYGTLAISLRCPLKEKLSLVSQEIQKAFATYLFSSASGKIEEAIQDHFIAKKRRLVCAESCTGGRLSAVLTAIPGASNYFIGSLVTYSNEMKHEQLRVSERTLVEKGAVSAEVVQEMLQGLFHVTNADVGIAVSGIAGPSGGTPEKPIGTIWAAFGERNREPMVACFRAKGTRETIILFTVYRMLGKLWRFIKYGVYD